ncbi:hypothetical protein N1851_024602 [Merluccius polli]|uniref:Uncharacterized protein n=1 Tax=Merluccius polli TaxID=89951 RepID=A0AA47MF11_MERPO|nr:hypothetical protein N1851_024602 [Merluccius polli]
MNRRNVCQTEALKRRLRQGLQWEREVPLLKGCWRTQSEPGSPSPPNRLACQEADPAIEPESTVHSKYGTASWHGDRDCSSRSRRRRNAHALWAASLEPLAVWPVVLLLVGEAATAFATAHLRTLFPGGEAHYRRPSWKALHQGLAARPGKPAQPLLFLGGGRSQPPTLWMPRRPQGGHTSLRWLVLLELLLRSHCQVSRKLPQIHPLLSFPLDDDSLFTVHKQTHFIRLQAQRHLHPTCPGEGVPSREDQAMQPMLPLGTGSHHPGGAGVRGLTPNQVHSHRASPGQDEEVGVLRGKGQTQQKHLDPQEQDRPQPAGLHSVDLVSGRDPRRSQDKSQSRAESGICQCCARIPDCMLVLPGPTRSHQVHQVPPGPEPSLLSFLFFLEKTKVASTRKDQRLILKTSSDWLTLNLDQLLIGQRGSLGSETMEPWQPQRLLLLLFVHTATATSGWGGCLDAQDVFAAVRENSPTGELIAQLSADVSRPGTRWSVVGRDADWFFLEEGDLRLNAAPEKTLDREVNSALGYDPL